MKKVNYTPDAQVALLTELAAHYGETVLTNKQVLAYTESNKLPYPTFLLAPARQISWGKYSVALDYVKARTPKSLSAPSPSVSAAQTSSVDMACSVVHLASKRASNITENFVPEKDVTYVSFGFHNDLKNILGSRIFYPIYITGLSGNGKTKMVEQVCSQLKRECVRVNITKDTDETDLIGSYELIDGNTVRREGPVITAMRRGAVLLLDEVDLGTERLLCLQPILEGNPYFDKKTGELVHPAAGFTVIATANTKGKGSDDGRFIGTNVLNEAFLERFAIAVEQEYPSAATEKRILQKNFEELGISDDTFIECLATWSEIIRKAFYEDAVDEIISTRRLVHISKAYAIFKDRKKAITMCLNRFDAETKVAFLDFYTKIDSEVSSANTNSSSTGSSTVKAPFNWERADSSIEWAVMAQRIQNAIGSRAVIQSSIADQKIVLTTHGYSTVIEAVTAMSMGSDFDKKLIAIAQEHKERAIAVGELV